MNWNSGRILLVWAFVLQNIAISDAQTVCSSDANPFIGELVSHGVELYPNPNKTKVACAAEWQDYGSCCEPASLVKYATKETDELKKANKLLHKEVLAVGASLLNNQVLEVVSLITSQFKTGSSKDKQAKLAAAMASVKNITELISRVTPHLQALNRTDDVCINKLSEIMTSSYCSTCSARSKVFFKADKAIMKQSDCDRVIAKCHAYWSSLIFVLDEIGSISHLISGIQNLEKSKESANNTNTTSIEFLSSWVREHRLRQRFENCTSPKKCNEAAAICSSLITIRKRFPLFQFASLSLHSGVIAFKNLKISGQLLSANSSKLAPKMNSTAVKSNFSKKRLLESSFDMSSLPALFHSDVSVVPDSQFSSTEMPMNFDIKFP